MRRILTPFQRDHLRVLAVGTAGLLCWVGAGLTEVFHGVSANWGPEMQITDPDSNCSGGVGRMLAVDGSGVVHVVYHTPDNFRVFYTRSADAGTTWTSPFQLSTGSLVANGPNMAVGPQNRLHVAWVNDVAGEPAHIYYRRFVPGSGWDPAPRDISGTLAYEAHTPSISVDLRGNVQVAWHIGEEPAAPSVYHTRSTDAGDSFTTPQQISKSDTTVHAAVPRFGVQGTNGAIVAIPWRDLRPPDSTDGNVYMAVSSDTGKTFTEYEVPTTSGSNELDPTAIVDADSVIHLVYTQEDSGATFGMATYQRSTDLGVTWTTEYVLTDEPSRFSWWAYDHINKYIWLLWKDERDGIPGDAKSDLMVTRSTDGGLTWEAREFVTDLGDLDARFAAIAVAPNAEPYAIWSDLRNGDTLSTVLLKHRDPSVVGVDGKDVLTPDRFVLHPAVPNPLNGRTVIRYELMEQADVRIEVYDVLGRRVRTLVKTPGHPAGSFEVAWDVRDDRGRRLAPGIYLCRMDVAGIHQTRKLILPR